ncbi:hypothetical protein Y1Q_0004142 [Alligator mississippiensis]|uniref:Uncharacterized protein n=1 Tax=Alligator mississippiensis TaxID=8496 RepID=A0A151PI61_ALLMI|nr:hypothetical protein Y1Q_0004142 [Alligator mississippiensis]
MSQGTTGTELVLGPSWKSSGNEVVIPQEEDLSQTGLLVLFILKDSCWSQKSKKNRIMPSIPAGLKPILYTHLILSPSKLSENRRLLQK